MNPEKSDLYLFVRGPLQGHSQVGSMQGGMLERLCRTPELQAQLEPKWVLIVKLPNLKAKPAVLQPFTHAVRPMQPFCFCFCYHYHESSSFEM